MQHAPLSLEVADQTGSQAPSQTSWDVGGVLIQQIQIGESKHGIHLLLRAGPGEDLDSFRRDHPSHAAHFSAITKTRICGKPASRQTLEQPEQHIACVISAAGNHPAYIPPLTEIAVAFEHGGLPVRVSLRIETKLVPEYRTILERFFSSIACL